MGSEIVAAPGASLRMTFGTCLDGLMDRIEIVRDDVLIHTFSGQRNQISEFSGEVTVEAAEGPHAYYVRVFQTDGGRAWSSPIWIAPSF